MEQHRYDDGHRDAQLYCDGMCTDTDWLTTYTDIEEFEPEPLEWLDV